MSNNLHLAQSDTAPEHVHRWKTVMHLDGCHHFSWTYACDCGASAMKRMERDPVGDPYSLVWMDPEGAEPCERCDEIRAGADLTHTLRVVLKDGTVEKDESVTHKQGEDPE